jgi:lysophospholipase L1-like esterase
MPDKKHILVYGDSLTWGIVPATRERHAFDERWPQVVQTEMGDGVRITTEAIPGRTTVWDDPFRTGRNGRKDFMMVLQSHAPVDLVVIMLGLNDLQKIYPGGAAEAAKGVGLIAGDGLNHVGDGQPSAPKVIIIAPTLLVDCENMFPVMAGGAPESLLLARELELVAKDLGCGFFDVSKLVKASTDDGVHLDRDNTIALGKVLVEPIRKALEG